MFWFYNNNTDSLKNRMSNFINDSVRVMGHLFEYFHINFFRRNIINMFICVEKESKLDSFYFFHKSILHEF